MLQALDFTSLYIPSIAPSAAARLRTQGYGLAQIGFDSAAASANVLAAVLGAGLAWDAYRFLTWSLDVRQAQSAIDGIHAFTPDEARLPGYLFFDAEENAAAAPAPANPADYFHRLRLYVEGKDITPHSLVKPGIYTRKSWWEQYCAGYTELAEAGWALWTAEEATDPDHATPYGGWSGAQIAGVQNRWEIASPIGTVDASVFRDRGERPAPSASAIAALTATLSDGSTRSLYP